MTGILLHRLPAAAAAALVAFTCAGPSGNQPPPREIKIAVELPLDGADGLQGTPALNGVRFALRKQPLVEGYRLSLASFDDTVAGVQNSEKGARNLQQMLADPRVLGVVGPFSSSLARAEIPIANQAHLAMISPATTNQCLTKDAYLTTAEGATKDISCQDAGLRSATDLRKNGPNNFFRVASTDDLQALALADFVSGQLKKTRMGVFSDNSIYGKSLADAFTADFQKKGGQVVGRRDFDAPDTTDFKPFLLTFKGKSAEGILFAGLTANKGCLIRAQMAGIFPTGEAAPFLGGAGIAQDPACVLQAGTNAVGVYGTVSVVNPDQVPGAQAAIQEFKKAFPGSADYGPYTMLAYDATNVLIAAVGRALRASGGKLPSREAVRAEVAATADFPGATQTISFDAHGDTRFQTVTVYESKSAYPDNAWVWVAGIKVSLT